TLRDGIDGSSGHGLSVRPLRLLGAAQARLQFVEEAQPVRRVGGPVTVHDEAFTRESSLAPWVSRRGASLGAAVLQIKCFPFPPPLQFNVDPTQPSGRRLTHQ